MILSRRLVFWTGAVAFTAAPFFLAQAADASVGAHLQMRPAMPIVFPLLQSKSQPAKSTHGTSSAKSKPGQASKAPAKKRAVSRRRPRGQQAPSADRIKEIQTALAREGHYQGDPTGKLDTATVQAVKSYQQANALTPSGKLDAKTLQRLGLGSGTAGQAPPRTAASAERASDNPRR